MIFPTDASTFTEAFQQGAEVYQHLKSLAKKKYGTSAGNVGDEGGVAPDIQSAKEALELISQAIDKAGLTGKMKIAMDVASSEFYRDGKYDLDFKNPESDQTQWISSQELADLYVDLAKQYPIVRFYPLNNWALRIVLKIHLSKTIGRHGHTLVLNTTVKSSVTIWQ